MTLKTSTHRIKKHLVCLFTYVYTKSEILICNQKILENNINENKRTAKPDQSNETQTRKKERKGKITVKSKMVSEKGQVPGKKKTHL